MTAKEWRGVLGRDAAVFRQPELFIAGILIDILDILERMQRRPR